MTIDDRMEYGNRILRLASIRWRRRRVVVGLVIKIQSEVTVPYKSGGFPVIS